MPDTPGIDVDLPDALVGPRVVVRPYDEADAPRIWEAIEESRETVGEWMPWVAEYRSPDDAVAFARRVRARWLLREDLIVGIFDRQSGRLLGGSGLQGINWTIRKFDIGYWLRTSAVGHGYVSETVQVLTRFAFDQLGACRIGINIDSRNQRSRAVPERLGFVYEGRLRNAMPDVTSRPRDIEVFSLIREEYEALPWRTLQSSPDRE